MRLRVDEAAARRRQHGAEHFMRERALRRLPPDRHRKELLQERLRECAPREHASLQPRVLTRSDTTVALADGMPGVPARALYKTGMQQLEG